ncbi:hypothetical protein JJQ72_02700 [Paenibacillus sp. F411]|uniref:hypothetical protein n=1 Tax=Paenibacillus TaxID=44249 RepID=UPI0010FF1810|nr:MULTISPECIES: hypothetical protein [Paenibacillus]MBO2942887.1 hypothetical protein [Paenibacillus sp. F411]
MRYRLIGFLCIVTGICLVASQLLHDQSEQGYVYPPSAQVDPYPAENQSSDRQMIADGCSPPYKTVTTEVSEAEAKKLREEAGYSSEGVSGGIIVESKETDSCS